MGTHLHGNVTPALLAWISLEEYEAWLLLILEDGVLKHWSQWEHNILVLIIGYLEQNLSLNETGHL